MLKPTTRRAGSGGCRARPRAVEPPSRFILAEDAWQCVWRTMVCSVGSDRWQMSKLDGDAAGSGAAFGHDVGCVYTGALRDSTMPPHLSR